MKNDLFEVLQLNRYLLGAALCPCCTIRKALKKITARNNSIPRKEVYLNVYGEDWARKMLHCLRAYRPPEPYLSQDHTRGVRTRM